MQFVDDVRPYELMKLRLLNASHQAIAYFGTPLGYVLVDEALGDERIRTYLERYMADEAAPTLGELPGIDLEGYLATLIERFSNPRMRDTLVRLADRRLEPDADLHPPGHPREPRGGATDPPGRGDGRRLGGLLGADRRAARSCRPRCPMTCTRRR